METTTKYGFSSSFFLGGGWVGGTGVVPTKRLQVAQDSFSSCLGSGSMLGGIMRESRNCTILGYAWCHYTVPHNPGFCALL